MTPNHPPRSRSSPVGDLNLHEKALRARLIAGTGLCRNWQGVEHTVTVLHDGGFDWQGRRYASLSAVARAITGTRWNGPLFFGLRGGFAA